VYAAQQKQIKNKTNEMQIFFAMIEGVFFCKKLS
jgi:hypothetical protein